ncbi:MAG TPA: hypothetical protein VFA33_20540 [Bryobacteraceae bacterium]|nr:hypothetical protein [Bryobacteraceae bacterium]
MDSPSTTAAAAAQGSTTESTVFTSTVMKLAQTYNPGGYVDFTVTNVPKKQSKFSIGDTPANVDFNIPWYDPINSNFANHNVVSVVPNDPSSPSCYIWQNGAKGWVYYNSEVPSSYTDGTKLFYPGGYWTLTLTNVNGAMVPVFTPWTDGEVPAET